MPTSTLIDNSVNSQLLPSRITPEDIAKAAMPKKPTFSGEGQTVITNQNLNGAFSTPSKRATEVTLEEAMPGATPGKHTDPQFKCIYPPSERTQGLIVEHFGFLPIAFIDEIINAANDTIYQATDALSKFVEKEQGISEATSQAVNKAETLLEHEVDKNFDKFELYALRNLFNIPVGLEDHIRLSHYEAADSDLVSAEDEAALDRELEQTRQQLITNNLLKARLQRDTDQVEKRVNRLRALNSQITMDGMIDSAFGGQSAAAAAMELVYGGTKKLQTLMDELNTVVNDSSSVLKTLDNPTGRDVYLAKMSEMQVSQWAQNQEPSVA